MAVLILIGALTPALAQQVNIAAQLSNPNIKVFMLSDFNFTGTGSSSGEVFALTITSTSQQREDCRLVMRIRSQGKGELASGSIKLFAVESNAIIRITNQNLFTNAQIFSLEDYNIEQAGDDLRNSLLATGKLPSDVYFFEFELTQLRTGYVSQAVVNLDVTNPTTLDLISPGAVAGNAEPPQIFTILPFFRWESNIQEFRLIIAEKLPTVHDASSPQEIIQDRVRFDKRLKVDPTGTIGSVTTDGSEIIPSTAYQYPPTGAYPLERGKTYYWQIIGVVESSGSPVELPSEIWAFQIGGAEGQMLRPEQQLILDQLNLLLPGMMQGWLAAGGNLAGFNPTGVIVIDGKPATVEQLQALFAKILSGELEIKNASCQ